MVVCDVDIMGEGVVLLWLSAWLFWDICSVALVLGMGLTIGG